MIESHRITVDLEPGSADDAHLRMKLNASGNAEVAGVGEPIIGYLDADTNTNRVPGGRQVAAVVRPFIGANFAIAGEALAKGDGFVGGADGKVALEADLSLAEGQVLFGGASGSRITVCHY